MRRNSSGGDSGSSGGDSGGAGDAAQGEPPEDYPPAVGITARAPGKASDTTAWVGNPAIMRPNDDNDDGVVAAPGAPPHHDNEDTDIDPKDDDITKVYIGIDRGKGRNSAISGTVIVTLPASGFKIYNSPAGGTVLSGSYTLDLENPSGPLAPLITTGGICLYVETAPGTLQSGDITITSELALDNGFTAYPNSNLPLLTVEFKLRQHSDVLKGWDDTGGQYWTSVGKSGTNNWVKLVLPAGVDPLKYELVVKPGDESQISLQGNAITGAETNFTITGLDSGDRWSKGTTSDIQVRVKATGNVVQNLSVHCFTPRTVTVAVYRIVDSTIPATSTAGAGQVDQTDAAIIEGLNSTFQSQAGVTFIVDPSSCNVDVAGKGIYDSTGSITLEPGRKALDIEAVLRQTIGEMVYNKLSGLKIYLVKRMETNSGASGLAFINGHDVDPTDHVITAECYVTRYVDPTDVRDTNVVNHEVGHGLTLSNKGTVANGYHDEGPTPDLYFPPPLGGHFSALMHNGGESKWIRHSDWATANFYGVVYELQKLR